ILLLMAWGLGLSRSAWLVLLVSTAAFLTIYFNHLLAGTTAPVGMSLLTQKPVISLNRTVLVLGNMPGFVLTSLTSDHSSAVLWFTRISGLFSLLALVGLVWLWWRGRTHMQWLLPLIGVCL